MSDVICTVWSESIGSTARSIVSGSISGSSPWMFTKISLPVSGKRFGGRPDYLVRMDGVQAGPDRCRRAYSVCAGFRDRPMPRLIVAPAMRLRRAEYSDGRRAERDRRVQQSAVVADP